VQKNKSGLTPYWRGHRFCAIRPSNTAKGATACHLRASMYQSKPSHEGVTRPACGTEATGSRGMRNSAIAGQTPLSSRWSARRLAA
jgi:hypothetical protein